MAESDPTRIVADADVLAADLLVGGPAREALDRVREHDWLTLVASDALLADAEAVIADIAGQSLATDWRNRIESDRHSVDHPDGDHPALASAVAGDAGHVLTCDENLTGAEAGLALRKYTVSVRTPGAFLAVFDPESLYEATVGDDYPSPDYDSRQ
jgi:predicted nucleic acid-binding protein